MENKRNYHAVLGISKNASEAEIKKAYRNLAKKYHPDMNPNDKESEKKFKEINEAYEILSDSQRKAEYNGINYTSSKESGTQRSKEPFSNGKKTNINLDDLFSEDLDFIKFSNDYNKYHRKKSETKQESSETEYASETSTNICKHCKGSGKERVVTQGGFGKVTKTRVCSICKGKKRL